MKPLVFTLEAQYPLHTTLCRTLDAQSGELQQRAFPDGETYLRVISPVENRPCLIVANLSDPNPRVLPLLFLAETLRELGASQVGIVAPYLCYMRQDRRFNPGEALTSKSFATLISAQFDWLVTVDPHLHRYHSLSEIYTIPNQVVHGTEVLADWLNGLPREYLLVGPDAESEQWVRSIAERTNRPYAIGHKQRHGDRDVSVSLPDLGQWRHLDALIVDDVIASGHTLLETLALLKNAGFAAIDCAAVHGIFADNADERMQQQGLRHLITSNSIPHWSNNVDLSDALAGPIEQLINGAAR